MLWVPMYLIIGGIYGTFFVQPLLKKMLEEDYGNKKGEIISIKIAIIIHSFLITLWPLFLTLKVVSMFRKGIARE